MILSANSVNYTIPGKNLKASIENNLERVDLSGMTAGSDSVNAGNKPKKISVSLTIPKNRPQDLRSLNKVAEAVKENGDPKVYIISDEQANTLNIREVIFSGIFRSVESEVIRGWDVSFSLKEYRSTAEKKEAREKNKEISISDSDGKTTTPADTNSVLKQTIEVAKKAIKS